MTFILIRKDAQEKKGETHTHFKLYNHLACDIKKCFKNTHKVLLDKRFFNHEFTKSKTKKNMLKL